MKTRFYFLLSLFLILGFLTLDYFLNSKIIQLKSSKQERTASVVSMASKPVIGSKVQAAADTENNTETDSDSVIQFKAEFQNEFFANRPNSSKSRSY